MFGLFRKPAADKPDWQCLMSWQVVTYQSGEHWLSLQIEPMKDEPCRVYVPSAAKWQASAPAAFREERALVLQRLQAVRWNRDLSWSESDAAAFWHRHVNNPVEGSLESTPGGQQLDRMRLFDPNGPTRFSKHDSKRAWCSGAEQMCLQVSGPVSLDVMAVIPGSVFQEICLPALRRNRNVSLQGASLR